MKLESLEVGIDTGEFTPGYKIVSVGFALSADDGLVIQRAVGNAAEAGEELCLVRSPSQECVYEPFVKVRLGRASVSLRLTREAARTFGDECIAITFPASEQLFSQLENAMSVIFGGRAYYARSKHCA